MHASLVNRNESNLNVLTQVSLLGHAGSPIGLIITPIPFVGSSTGIGVIISIEMRMPFPSEPQNDTVLYKALFDNKYVSYTQLELESRYLIHSNRIHLPLEGVDLRPNPSKEELHTLSSLMKLVHQFDYLSNSGIQKQ